MFGVLGNITRQLALSADHLLNKQLNEFNAKHVKNAQHSRRQAAKATEDWENALNKAMLRKVGLAQQSKKGKPSLDDLLQADRLQLSSLRRVFELIRFQHTQLLNTLHSQHVGCELVELACASLFAFVTFFHEGSHQLDSVKSEVQDINREICARRVVFSQDTQIVDQQRLVLEKGLSDEKALEFRVEEALPSPVSRPRSTSTVTKGGKVIQVEKEGYLRKQADNLNKSWQRRWFTLQEGQLFYFRSYKDLNPVHVCNMLICTVRPLAKADLQFCFEIISPNKRVYCLQAESEADLKEWLAVFQNCVENVLTQQDHEPNAAEKKLSGAALKLHQEQTSGLNSQLRAANPTCADCDTPDPDWVCINHGIFICIECSGIHRNMGVHVSKVRSLSLDSWHPELLQLLGAIGNAKFNALYEGSTLADFEKPNPTSPRDVKDDYIRTKYQKKAFLSRTALAKAAAPNDLIQPLAQAAKAGDLDELLTLIALNADVNAVDPTNHQQTALHGAARSDRVLACELLIQNNANANATDDQGRSALDIATACASEKVKARLARMA